MSWKPTIANLLRAAIAGGILWSARSAVALCPADLPARIDAILAGPDWQRARWGMAIEELETGNLLYGRDRERYFLPASTAKLFVTAAALMALGPDFRWQTEVRQQGDAFYLLGAGDPSLTAADLGLLAAQLRARGIREIPRLVVVARAPKLPPTWEWEDLQAAYGVPASEIVVNENAVTLTLVPTQPGQPPQLRWSDAIAARQWEPIENATVTGPAGAPYAIELSARLGGPGLQLGGSLAADNGPDRWDLAIPDPIRYAAETFAARLQAQGIAVGDIARATTAPPGPTVVSVASPPLGEILAATNQDSNNLYAEALLQALSPDGSNDGGLDVLATALSILGVPPTAGYALVDGSGLSRQNLVAPATIARLLRQLDGSSLAAPYRASLAVAGESGTLARRFQNTPIAGNLAGKTGTMTGVTALAGYLTPPQYPPLVVSILLNRSPQPTKANRAAIDEIVRLLGQLEQCSS